MSEIRNKLAREMTHHSFRRPRAVNRLNNYARRVVSGDVAKQFGIRSMMAAISMAQGKNAPDMPLSIQMIPGVGDIYDASEAVKYLRSGDIKNSLLSSVGLVPFIPGMTAASKAAANVLPKKAADQGYEAMWRGGAPPKNNRLHGLFFSRDYDYAKGVSDKVEGRDFSQWAVKTNKSLKLNDVYSKDDLASVKKVLLDAGDKTLAPYFDEIVSDDWGGAMPGSMLYQMLEQTQQSADDVLKKAGFEAIDTGRDVKVIVDHGKRRLDAEFNPANIESDDVTASLRSSSYYS